MPTVEGCACICDHAVPITQGEAFVINGVSEKPQSAIRPVSVIWYERLAIVAVVATAASAVADRATLVKYTNQHPVAYPILVLALFAAQGLWIWLVARRRTNWARWISMISVIGGIPSVILSFEARFRFNPAMAIISCIAFVVSALAVSMLFRRDARDGFAGSRQSP
ncbi:MULTISPECIES: hypothetical protein [unclassified Bradyrhizobium]|uniref:hypothetical protein n=1 Tax=unclassified Bradyrhizobium TaxID=2631580 RepID=UPI0028F06A0C|nr:MULTISPECIES: hypothetical protein [unclassified Bradyrhizobium]